MKGHYYAAPVNIHMPAWFFYSKPVFQKAGIAAEPKTYDEFIADLGKLKAAGVIPLALGGQPWQEKITFDAVFADVGGPDLYLKVYRDRDQNAVKSDAFKKVLVAFKRLHDYVDPGSPGRNWNDATALVISGKAGVQIMGDWAKGEFSAANQTAGKDFGCFPGFGPHSPYLVAGDVFVFPKTDNRDRDQGAESARHGDDLAGRASRVQREERLDSDSSGRGCQQSRHLREGGHGDHEGQVASVAESGNAACRPIRRVR